MASIVPKMDSNAALALVPGGGAESTRPWYTRSKVVFSMARQTINIVNNKTVPCYLDVYECVARRNRDVEGNPTNYLEMNTTKLPLGGTAMSTINNPVVDLFSMPRFTANCMILRMKRYIIEGGKSIEWSHRNGNDYYYDPASMNAGDSYVNQQEDFVWEGKTKFYVVRTLGSLTNDTGGGVAGYTDVSITIDNTRKYDARIVSSNVSTQQIV